MVHPAIASFRHDEVVPTTEVACPDWFSEAVAGDQGPHPSGPNAGNAIGECRVGSPQLGHRSDINQRQRREGWGAAVIPRLAQELNNELPEVKGFSERNIGRMIAFYRENPRLSGFLPQLAAKLSDSILCCVPWFHQAPDGAPKRRKPKKKRRT